MLIVATTTTSTGASYDRSDHAGDRSPADPPRLRLGRARWVVERTFGLASSLQAATCPLRPSPEIHEAFLALWLLPRLLQETRSVILLRVLAALAGAP
jgi:hypothetical protein